MFSCPGTAHNIFLSSLDMPFFWTLAAASAALQHHVAGQPLVQRRIRHRGALPSAVQHSQRHQFVLGAQLETTSYAPHDSSALHTRVQTPHQHSHTERSLHLPPASFSAAVASTRSEQCGWKPEPGLAFSFLPFFSSLGVTVWTRLFIAFVSTYNQISFPGIMQLGTCTPGGMNPVQCPPPTSGCSVR